MLCHAAANFFGGTGFKATRIVVKAILLSIIEKVASH